MCKQHTSRGQLCKDDDFLQLCVQNGRVEYRENFHLEKHFFRFEVFMHELCTNIWKKTARASPQTYKIPHTLWILLHLGPHLFEGQGFPPKLTIDLCFTLSIHVDWLLMDELN
jgi:hypothetical protein